MIRFFKSMYRIGIVTTCLSTGLYFVSPAARTAVNYQIHSVAGWTEAARQADPVGFTSHVEATLTRDLRQLEETRRTLHAEVGLLARKYQEQTALRQQALTMADEFKAAWQRHQFPVTIRHAAYTESELLSQVRTLQAEADGYHSNVSQLSDVKIEAEKRLEEITVRIEKTRSDLAAVTTQRELLRTRQLTEDGQRLLAQVDELLHGNRVAIENSNPVRSVRELLASTPVPHRDSSADRVLRFLNEASTTGQDSSSAEKAIATGGGENPATAG